MMVFVRVYKWDYFIYVIPTPFVCQIYILFLSVFFASSLDIRIVAI